MLLFSGFQITRKLAIREHVLSIVMIFFPRRFKKLWEHFRRDEGWVVNTEIEQMSEPLCGCGHAKWRDGRREGYEKEYRMRRLLRMVYQDFAST